MSIQVNIFNSGSVPTATELANFISELNTDLDSIVTLNTEQIIEGAKTFWGSKMLKFKQKTSADKLGFTFYDNQGKEVGNFEYDNKNNFRLLALGNYFSAANQEIEGHVGFKVYNKSALAAYRLLCPLAGNAKNSISSLTDTYTNFYMPLIFTNGAASVMTDNNGKVDLSTLIGSGGSSGDVSGLATVATTGDYYDLLNRPILFSGNYNDLTNKPTLFSGSYGDLTDKPTLFSGDYNDLTNKPTIPTVDITKALADSWYQPLGNYALKSELFSGSYNDLTDKPSLFSGNYNDLTNKPTLFSGSYNDLTDKPTLFSGSYNDLSDKPTIPTVPAISTNITNDATSDTKTASPKAVKDFVEGKGYLTQHQDISGKADQTDLEALEDRVETLEQSGGSAAQYSYLKLIPDLDAYTEAPVGEIVKYIGQTNNKYTRGWDYECVVDGSDDVITLPIGTKSCWLYNNPSLENLGLDRQFYALGTEQFNYSYNSSTGRVFWKQNPAVGDYALWQNASNSTQYEFCRIIEILSNGIKYEYSTTSGYRTATLHSSSPWTYNTLINADGIILYYWSNTIDTGTKNNIQIVDWDNQKSYVVSSQNSQTTEEITIGTPTISWQPIIHPAAPISSGD